MKNSKGSRERSFLRHGLLRSKGQDRSPSPEKVDKFLRERVGSFRIAPPGPSQYDDQENRYKPRNDIAVEDLEKIIDAHDKYGATALRVSSSSWNTVFDLMADAKRQKEEKKDHGSKVGLGIEITSSFIDLMPDDYGLGILKGGLALIFDATSRHIENRSRILDTFETLPDTIITINTAHSLLEPDPSDVELQEEFLSMLFEDIPALIKILLGTEAWYRKVVGVLMLKIPEKSTIDDILGRWTQQLGRLKEHVEKLKIRLLAKVSAKQDSDSIRLKSIQDTVEASGKGIRDLLAGEESLQQIIDDRLKEQTAAINMSVAAIGSQIYADVATIFREELRNARRDRELDQENWARERKQLEQTNLHLRNQSSRLASQVAERQFGFAISKIQLLGVLGLSTYDPGDDLDFTMRHADRFDAGLKARAQWLVQTEEFRDWLREDASSVLLVDGCMDIELISPLSGLCCGLISSLVDDPDSVVAFFFAGLHTGKVISGPDALMRSLISQLLLSSNLPKPNLGFLSQDMLEGCIQRDCRALCKVFVKLVKQIPSHMHIFCILDGVSWYEQEPWLNDMHYIATMFESLAKRPNYGHSGLVKVLMTSPNQSIELVDLVMNPDSVWRHVALAAGDIHPAMGAKLAWDDCNPVRPPQCMQTERPCWDGR